MPQGKAQPDVPRHFVSRDDPLPIGPETGDFMSKPRAIISEYDRFSQELMSKIELSPRSCHHVTSQGTALQSHHLRHTVLEIIESHRLRALKVAQGKKRTLERPAERVQDDALLRRQ